MVDFRNVNQLRPYSNKKCFSVYTLYSQNLNISRDTMAAKDLIFVVCDPLISQGGSIDNWYLATGHHAYFKNSFVL